MDNLDAFREELIARVRVRASADANFSHSAFVEVCGDLLGDAEEFGDLEPCYFRGKGLRNRNLAVDGYAFDDADDSLRLLVAEYSGGGAARTVTRTDAKPAFAALIAFVEEALRGAVETTAEESAPVFGLAREIRNRAAGIARYRCYLATDHVLSERVRDWPEGDIGGVPVEFHIWDAGRFNRAHQSISGRDELVVDFNEIVGGGIPCLPASVDAGAYEGYLCVIPGKVLADIYDRYGSRLLEGNVRAFLSTSVKVNKGMQKTLAEAPDRFFAYNNGIAATASGIEIVRSVAGTCICAATDFQIVNGGQTTASLAYARRQRRSQLDGVFVQMKLSVVHESDAGDFIPLISRYSNSQNKVSDADFFSNHEFHRTIEKISRRVRAPARGGSQVETFWFYERARGQHSVELNRRTAAEQKRFELESPRDQVITKTDLGKVENSWRRLPHEVSRGAQKNFVKFAELISREWDEDPTRFHDEYFRSTVARIIIFRTLEKLVPKEPWYDGGYRAQIVTYSVAKLADMLSVLPGRVLNLQQIWKQQAVSAALTKQLRLIAKEAYSVVTAPEAGIQNVTEWCKKELAWSRFKTRAVKLLPEFEAELVGADVVAARNRDARVDAKVDMEVEAVTKVLDFGSGNWATLSAAAAKANAVSPDEANLLRVAMNPRWVPTDRQAKALISLRARLEDDGVGR